MLGKKKTKKPVELSIKTGPVDITKFWTIEGSNINVRKSNGIITISRDDSAIYSYLPKNISLTSQEAALLIEILQRAV